MTNIIWADYQEVSRDCYTVRAVLPDNSSVYHEGPSKYPYFTLEQAEFLACKVRFTGKIDLKYWIGEHNADPWKEYAQIEEEYYEDGRDAH